MASVQPYGFDGLEYVALRLGQQHRFGCGHPKMGRNPDSASLVEKVVVGLCLGLIDLHFHSAQDASRLFHKVRR